MKVNSFLVPPGFTAIDLAIQEGLVLALWGREKAGKTHTALTFPEPIYLLHPDMGAREIIRKHFPTKFIVEHAIKFLRPGDIDEATQRLSEFQATYQNVLDCAGTGTVIIDTATRLWQIVHQVKLYAVQEARAKTLLAKGKQVDPESIRPQQFEWANANLYMANLLTLALHASNAHGTNTVFIHHAKTVYAEGGVRTNQLELDGFGRTAAITPYTVYVYSEPGRDGQVHTQGRIDRCRSDRSLEGLPISDVDYELLKGLFL